MIKTPVDLDAMNARQAKLDARAALVKEALDDDRVRMTELQRSTCVLFAQLRSFAHVAERMVSCTSNVHRDVTIVLKRHAALKAQSVVPDPLAVDAAIGRLKTVTAAYTRIASELKQDLEPPTPPAPPGPDELLEESKLKRSHRQEQGKVKALLAELEGLREQAGFWRELSGTPLPPVYPAERTSGLREGTVVAMFSDYHAETLVRPESTPTGNAYCLAIAEYRAQRFFRGVIWFLRAQRESFRIHNLTLWLGGDLITNYLHDENVETAQLGPGGAIMWVAERLESGIRYLLAEGGLERLDIVCSMGNHGRTTKTMRAATGADHSLEWLIYQMLAYKFRDDSRVHVLADRSMHQYHEIYGYKLHFHHGHEVNYGGGVGGITIPINKAVSGWDRAARCDYHHFGHFHQYIDTGNVVVNGSLIGYDSYALSIKASPEVPQQACYLLDSRRGKSVRMPIWVGKPEHEAALWRDRVAQ